MSSEQTEANDQQNSEKLTDGSAKSWEEFKHFAKALFSVKPEELEKLPPEEKDSEKEEGSLPSN
jgi:hypothetical protein